MDERVVDIALGFDFWVFGGYIRDVIIRDEETFGDIDIGCEVSDEYLIPYFLRMLATDYEVTVKESRHYGGMSPCMVRLIKITLDDTLTVDLCVFKSRDAWRSEKSADFTCNLFYQTRTTHLALRYIPTAYRNEPNPTGQIHALTCDTKFQVVHESEDPNHIGRVCERSRVLVDKGWTRVGPIVTPKTRAYLDGLGADESRRITGEIA
jgi:hypothetical protein